MGVWDALGSPFFVFWTTWTLRRCFVLGPPGPNFLIDLSYVFLRFVCCFSFLSLNLSVFFLQTFKLQPVGCSVGNVAKSFCSLLLTLELIVL